MGLWQLLFFINKSEFFDSNFNKILLKVRQKIEIQRLSPQHSCPQNTKSKGIQKNLRRMYYKHHRKLKPLLINMP